MSDKVRDVKLKEGRDERWRWEWYEYDPETNDMETISFSVRSWKKYSECYDVASELFPQYFNA